MITNRNLTDEECLRAFLAVVGELTKVCPKFLGNPDFNFSQFMLKCREIWQDHDVGGYSYPFHGLCGIDKIFIMEPYRHEKEGYVKVRRDPDGKWDEPLNKIINDAVEVAIATIAG